MTDGVVYLTWGERAMQQADVSIDTLWKCAPGMPVLVLGDAEAQKHYEGRAGITFKLIEVDPYGGAIFYAGRIKPLMAKLSPFDRSLYVDADTEFKVSPAIAFAMLDKWELIIAETETRSLVESIAGIAETRWTAAWLGTPHLLYHNSGMIFWRRCPATDRAFDLWAEEWPRFSGWDEQVALLRALLRSDCLYLTVPYSWNCREGKRTFLLHHRFGTRVARKDTGRGGRAVGHVSPLGPPRRIRPPQPRPRLVSVEVAPGQTVQCRPGEEKAVAERFRLLGMRRRERKVALANHQ